MPQSNDAGSTPIMIFATYSSFSFVVVARREGQRYFDPGVPLDPFPGRPVRTGALHYQLPPEELGRGDAEVAGEDGHAGEEPALLVGQGLVAPVERGLQRLVPGRRRPRPADEQAEAVAEPFGDLGQGRRKTQRMSRVP